MTNVLTAREEIDLSEEFGPLTEKQWDWLKEWVFRNYVCPRIHEHEGELTKPKSELVSTKTWDHYCNPRGGYVRLMSDECGECSAKRPVNL